MSRVTSASQCRQQIQAIVANRPVTVECARGQGHVGVHQGKVKWPLRSAAPSPGRRV